MSGHLLRLPHRQIVFTFPKVIRIFFRHGHGLVGDVSRLVYRMMQGVCSAAAGMINLTRSIALEYAQYSIRANAICPGQVEEAAGQSTQRDHLVRDLNEYVRKCKTIEVAYAALFLASDESSDITGTTLVIDGGLLDHAGHGRWTRHFSTRTLNGSALLGRPILRRARSSTSSTC